MKKLYSLRLCAFIDMGYQTTKANIPFSQQFSARFITIVPVSTLSWREEGDPTGENVDIQTIYFEGHRIPSLLRKPTQNQGDVEMFDEQEEESKMQI